MKPLKIKSKEPQYNIQFKTIVEKGPVCLGPTCSHLWRNDPKHLAFLLARYKFCAKILTGKKNVLEIGCGDSFGTRLILQTVRKVHAIDFDPLFINWSKKLFSKEGFKVSFQVLNIINELPSFGLFDGAYSLDFIEHIRPESESMVMDNICKVLSKNSTLIIGTPNIMAKKYASLDSQKGHVNLKDAESLRRLLGRYFNNVLIFSMNDEVVHTGFSPMANYILGVASGLRNSKKEK